MSILQNRMKARKGHELGEEARGTAHTATGGCATHLNHGLIPYSSSIRISKTIQIPVDSMGDGGEKLVGRT